ncbi:MAG TPA: hypothetical protein VEQ16_09905, partial [Acidocella sp.]|nr:hypothetical protein [Acidocella sp.]
MSGTGDVTFGGSGYFPGMVTISASSLFGSLGSSSVNDLIKTFLTNVTDGVTTSGINFANWDLPASAVLAGESVTGSTTNRVDQYADMTTGGGTTSGSAAPATVGSSSQDVLMQFSGNVTLAGNSGTQTLVIGDSTNADYTVTDAAAGTMFLAGGANSVTLYNTSGSTNESIYSAGNDTINLHGSGSAVVSIYGNGTVIDQDVNASVVAAGSASVGLHWENVNSGGTLHFVNNSSVAATIYIGNQGSQFASTRVTADGGAGGGFFVGGSSGQNSLVGGSGVVTLLGAGAGDFLEAQSSIGTNVLGQGVGLETLVATSTTG